MNSSTSNQTQLALPLGVGDKASFANFWVGHNDELVTALNAMVAVGDPKFLYFYGAQSSGKSHLLFAAIRMAKEEVVNTSYLSLKNSQVTTAHLNAVDVQHLVCIDDLDHWAGDLAKEQALFSLFEQIKHAGGQLLISASQPPQEYELVLPDLASRLNSGLIYALEALTEYQQFEAIRLRAGLRGLTISSEAIRFLLSRSSRDTRELFDLLDTIDRASLVEKRKITIPFLQSIIMSTTGS